MSNVYRFDCKTISDVHPSQNRKWFTIADGSTPEEAFARVQSYRPDENIEILATWLQIGGPAPAVRVRKARTTISAFPDSE